MLDILDEHTDAIILLDIKMPFLNGLDAALQIQKLAPRVKIIILSTYQEWHLIQKAKQFGCKAYLTKTADKEELVDVIYRVNAGELCFQKIEDSKKIAEEPDDIVKKYKLTRRELEILDLLKQELTNKDISEKLFLSIYTIETHRKNIMQKLGLKSPQALIRFFMNDIL